MMLFACGGSDGDDNNPAPPETASPEAANLVFPEDNTVCNISEILSETQSRVTFIWDASENTDTYELQVRNLETGNIFRSIVSDTEAPLTIQRGTPYEWSVTSMADNNNTEAVSASFRFFNEGPGIQNFAPFPAEVISPLSGSTAEPNNNGSILIEWLGEDIDNDISDFEVFISTSNPPATSVGVTATASIELDLEANTIYFWQVISRDTAGNTSNSPIYQFRTQ